VVLTDWDNEPCRVFFGPLLATESLSKSVAANSPQYSAFFNVNGNFKRPSVLSGTISPASVPKTARTTPVPAPDEVSDSESFIEGAARSIVVNAYERNAAARAACIAIYGTVCVICGFDFGKTYGADADGYTHVHHLKPLSMLRKTYKINPKTDLRPVCPNCHAVIHLGSSVRSIEEVKVMMFNAKKSK
jgi:hypothetical protein